MKHHQISKFFRPAKRKADSGAGIIGNSTLKKFRREETEAKGVVEEKIDEGLIENSIKEQKETKKEQKEPKKETKEPKKNTVTQLKSKSTKPARTKLTPLEGQILELKAQNEDKLLAVQVGYKYKFYGEDAKIVSKLINIMLIPNEDHRFDYCSIPDNRLHVHLKRLLSHGYKVGVVKQLDSSNAQAVEGGTKSLFSRELTGVYTSATYMNEEVEEGRNMVLDDHNGEYIVCINQKGGKMAVCFVRPITGEIVVDEFEDDDLNTALETRLVYYKPSECLIGRTHKDEDEEGDEGRKGEGRIKKLVNSVNNTCRIETKNFENTLEELESFFTDSSSLFDYYKLNFDPLVLDCVNQLIKYLTPFKLATIFTIPSNITKFKNSDFMILSSNVLKTLEVFENSTDNTTRGSLICLLNHTRTRMGERLLHKWVSRPLVAKERIIDRVNSIEDLTSGFNHFIDCMRKMLSNDFDLEKSLIKLHYSIDKVKITRSEVYTMLKKFNEILQQVQKFGSDIKKLETEFKSKELVSIFTELLDLSNSFDIESQYLKMISTTYGTSKDFKEQRANYFNMSYHSWPEISEQQNKIKQVLQDIERETEAVSKVLKRPTKLVKCLNQENLIEVRNSQIDRLPIDWIRISSTKAITRFRSPALQKLNNLLAYNNELLDNACDEVFEKFLISINDNFFNFNKIISNLSKFDCLLSLAVTKAEGIKPVIVDEDSTIKIKNFKNPIINTLTTYITNDIYITREENRISLITGPNMGGKSSYIKSIGILVIMNQIGCYLPCESAEVSIFSDIFIRMGSFDNIIKGQSTFMIEMLEVLQILENFNNKSLILLDEIGRGTGTTDGYLIAYSILKYLAAHATKPIVLFITHFHKLTQVCNEFGDMNNFYMDFFKENDEIVFLYKMVKGTLDNSYGLNVANLAGIPEQVIGEARVKAQELRKHDQLNYVSKVVGQMKKGDFESVFDSIE